MNSKLLALSIFKNNPDVVTGVANRTEIDYQEVILNIFFKFIDVLEGAVIIIVGLYATRFIKKYFARIETLHEQQRTALNLLEKITNGFVIAVAVTLGLKVIGLDLTLLISVLTLGISFGLRDVIKNYVAGLLILFKAPFEIGDVVKIRSFTGKVEKIEFQAVTIRTFDHKEVTIHNSDLLTQPLTNFSRRQQTRLEINLMLGYGTDMPRALKIFDALLQNHPLVLKSPKYSIIVRDFAERGVNAILRFWAQKPCNSLKIRTELSLQIQEAFDEAQIFAPYGRESQLVAEYGMTAARQERLRAFYGQPALANIAGAVAVQVGAAVTNGIGPAPAAAEEYADADEPE